MSRYGDDYRRSRDYAYGSDGASHRRPASPSQARLTYEPQAPFYPPEDSPQLRPRSFPPPIEMISRASSRSRNERQDQSRQRSRSNNKYDDDDDDNSDRGLDWDSDENRIQTRSRINKARKLVGGTFTDSPTGIGVSVLGALLGGLAVREAADYRYKGSKDKDKDHHHHHPHHDDPEHKRNQLISTVVGAAVGALGANALERRIENHRARDDAKQEKWERKWRPNNYPVDDHDDHGSGKGYEGVEERRDIVAVGGRPRSKSKGYGGGGSVRDSSDAAADTGRGGRSLSRRRIEREVDPGGRSWKNVEDWVLDGNNGGRPDFGSVKWRQDMGL